MDWLNDARLRPVQVALKNWALWIALLLAVPYILYAEPHPLWPGLVALALGELLQLWAAANLNKNAEVAISGPYTLIRNPMYVGRFLVMLGLVLWLPVSWHVVALYVIVYCAYAHSRVLREEKRLTAGLGQAYTDYCHRVGRWFPKRIPKEGRAIAWSWQLLAQNRQLRVTAGLLLLLALTYVRHAVTV